MSWLAMDVGNCCHVPPLSPLLGSLSFYSLFCLGMWTLTFRLLNHKENYLTIIQCYSQWCSGALVSLIAWGGFPCSTDHCMCACLLACLPSYITHQPLLFLVFQRNVIFQLPTTKRFSSWSASRVSSRSFMHALTHRHAMTSVNSSPSSQTSLIESSSSPLAGRNRSQVQHGQILII